MFAQLRRGGFKRTRSRAGRRTGRGLQVPVALEALEDRRLLATFLVTDPGSAGPGTLRDAIDQANAAPGADVIHFASGVNTVQLTAGGLRLRDDTTIEGPASGVTIARDPNNISRFRILTISSGVTATLKNLTLTGGDSETGIGGGIQNLGNLSLLSVTLAGNQAVMGGGIWNNPGGVLRVDSCLFFGNLAIESSPSGQGGGIYNGGTLTVTDTIFDQNAATQGGGINNLGTATIASSTFTNDFTFERGGGINNLRGGVVNVSGCTFRDNTSELGGGVNNEGTAVINSCTFDRNTASKGGGISNLGTASLTDSTLGTNTVSDSGGGAFNAGDMTVRSSAFLQNSCHYLGGGLHNEGHLVASSSLFAGNRTGFDSYGGGINNFGLATIVACQFINNLSVDGGGMANLGEATFYACTFQGNSAQRGAGLSNSFLGSAFVTACTFDRNNTIGSGGAIYNEDPGSVTVLSCTITGNIARREGGGIHNEFGTVTVTASTLDGNTANSSGGGIRNVSGRFTLINTIVAHSANGDVVGGLVNSSQGNLIGDGSGGLDPTTNLLNLEPLLGPLQDNGGPTLTRALLPGSPAIDAGVGLPGVTRDQRQFGRPAGAGFDIGAFEFGSETPSLLVDLATDTVDADDGHTSLREAIDFANARSGADAITFDSSVFDHPQTITLDPALGQLTLTEDLTITGPAGRVTIARSAAESTPAFRLIEIRTGVAAKLVNLALTGGRADEGGGILNSGNLTFLSGALIGHTARFGGAIANRPGSDATLESSTVSSNSATVFGGGIYSDAGKLVIKASTLHTNSAGNGGGGVLARGAGSLTIQSSTLSGNFAGVLGGGLLSSGGGLAVISSTIAGNVAGFTGGGIYNDTGNSAALTNTIVAGNVGGDIANLATLTGESNLIGDGSGGLSGTTNLLNVDPKLGPLLNNGGGTLTRALLSGSPAIDAGRNAAIELDTATDQRGAGFPRIRGGVVDIGAFEFSPPAAVVGVDSPTPDGLHGIGATVVVAVHFDAPVFVTGTPTLTLSNGGTATYASGSGSATLVFSYTVASGQDSPDLDAAGTGALVVGAGAIRTADGAAALLTLPAPGSAGSLATSKALVIDATAPTVVAFRVLYGSRSFNLLGTAGRVLPWQITGVQVVFSEAIANGRIGSLGGLSTTGVSGLGTTTLTWSFAALSRGTFSASLSGIGASALKDAAGNALGNGTGFTRSLTVLHGDFNGDGVVSAADVSGLRLAALRAYDPFADLNGDGLVDDEDVRIARGRIGTRL